MYILQLVDWYAASISVILVCLVEVIIVGWTYGRKPFLFYKYRNEKNYSTLYYVQVVATLSETLNS